ncbi:MULTISPECIES: bifunctional 2-polyprenyl-6-hydroxyphenol methylase/3-demethylubiquinol 3-O-methyltransferase UbiG [unclassified Phenylobacterium]|uniref:class I SAM-dependent methyltransferase n=1 Tax=unclassified Phenylobacterium TaxID=2640670 RepID=UPI00083B70CE|nr:MULTISPECIES: class I SAM-dependent methyltransferase [unclassified Phenylobacterium]
MTGKARNYDQEAGQFGDRKYNYDFDEIVRRYMMRAFEPFLPSGRALELGCYRGDSTAWLVGRYDDLTVIEAAPSLVEAAQARFGDKVRFFCSTFEAAELPERFDAIFLINTLEHLDDPVSVLRKIREWLTPRGRLFLLVPNAQAPSRQIAVKMGLITHNAAVTESERRNGHRHTFSFDTLERAARDGGLRAVHRGGLIFKGLANYQFDAALDAGIIDERYVEGCYQLGMQYPELCASIYLVCEQGEA